MHPGNHAQHHQPFSQANGRKRLQHLIEHLQSLSLPVADELQAYALTISQDLSKAYAEKQLGQKKRLYQDVLSKVRESQHFLLHHFDEEVISPYHCQIIAEDLKSLADELEALLTLLTDCSALLNQKVKP